jgi:photosystem II stability/assembly factor-like uncharacterized protein
LALNTHAQTEMEEEEENEENSMVRQLEHYRHEKLARSAGTKNLSLLNYRAAQKIRELTQQNEAARPQGYTPFNGSWQQVNTAQSSWGMGRINCFKVDPSNASKIYVGTPTGGLWVTENNGSNWACLTSGLGVTGISGICINPNNTNIIYILTGTASTIEGQSLGVFKSTDGGANWGPTGLDSSYVANWFYNPQFNAHKLVMDPNNANVLLAAMTSGLYRTEDGGATWARVIDDVEVKDIAFNPSNSSILYVTTGYKSARASNDNGRTFGPDRTLAHPSYIGNYQSVNLAVTPAAPDSVFFVATSDNGSLDSDTIYLVRALYSNSDRSFNFGLYNRCLISGGGYAVNALRWYRDGRLAISPTTTANMYINGLWTYSSSDYGLTWRSKTLDGSGNTMIHSDATQIDYVNGYVYASNDGGIYRQLASPGNATAAWTILSGTMPISQIFRIGASQTSTTKFALALQDNGCHEVNTVANTYTLLNSGDGVMARMNPLNQNTYYTMVNNYRIVRSVNNVNTDITPQNTLGYNFLPFEADQGDSNRIYAAYKNLWVSTNRGTNWVQRITGGTRDTRVMAISKTENGVFWLLEQENVDFWTNTEITPAVLRRSVDGGLSFQVIPLPANIPISYISSIVISPFDANRVYLTIDSYYGNAKVFVTTNGRGPVANITWTDLQSSTLPNVPVLCLAYESSVDNSIYIGTEIGMFYYNSDINRWIPFNNGMPVCRVNDLYINYAQLKIIAATYGRGIFIGDFYGTCPGTMSLSGSQSGILTYSAGTTLNSSAALSGGEASKIKYYSGSDVFLTQGFITGPGTNFVAGIAPCGGVIDPILNKNAADSSATVTGAKKISDEPKSQNKAQQDVAKRGKKTAAVRRKTIKTPVIKNK